MREHGSYDDIIGIDNLWCDGENINRASTRGDNDKVREIRMQRIGLAVDLTIAEKSSEEQSSVPNSCVEGRKSTAIIHLPEENVLAGPCKRWVKPVAVRVTSALSDELKVALDPQILMQHCKEPTM